jgi:ABC-2 type transport system ATP-binding protein
MDYGRIVALGTPDELKREVAGDVVTLGLGTPGSAANAGHLVRAAQLLGAESYVRQVDDGDSRELRLYVDDGGTALPRILRGLDGAGIPINAIELHRPSLDDVFLTRTGRSLRES